MSRITNPTDMHYLARDDVHYLALEGGGGKGVTYLGAIKALQELEPVGLLPIDIDQPGKNQIRGISGSSAGAITAMFLAMGYTFSELEKVLSKSSTFIGFFDAPSLA